MNEAQAAEKWLYSTLGAAVAVTALVSTRIYAGEVPQDGSYPCVLFNFGGADLTHAAGQDRRILARLYFSVRGISEGPGYGGATGADAIAAAVDDVLVAIAPGTTVTVGAQTYTILGSWQDFPLRHPETIRGKPHRHAGGQYVVDLHPS